MTKLVFWTLKIFSFFPFGTLYKPDKLSSFNKPCTVHLARIQTGPIHEFQVIMQIYKLDKLIHNKYIHLWMQYSAAIVALFYSFMILSYLQEEHLDVDFYLFSNLPQHQG